MNEIKNIENRPFPLLRPNPKESMPGAAFVAAGALAFWLLAMGKKPESLGLLALVCGVPVLGGLAWMIRRRYYQTIFLTGQLLLLVLARGELRREPFPLGVVPLLPAVLMVWGLFGMARKADELERRVLQAALAVAFGIVLCATLAYGVAETLGAPRAPAIAVLEVLVIVTWAGLVIAARRYR
jgi:hypothetical protein